VNPHILSTSLTTAEFIERARRVHGAKYDYSAVDYSSAKVKVKICCPQHGIFLQSPTNHISGYGCLSCALISKRNSRRLSIDNFIEKVKAIFGEEYDYTKVNYQGLRTKVQILCREHGVFEMTPGTHLKGRFCPKCTGRAFIPTVEFIERAKIVHKGRYDYSLVNCEHNRSAIKILCSVHGVFEQTPRNHLMGRGCQQCAAASRGLSKRTKAAEQFIAKAKKVHGDLYDYSRAEYKQNRENVTIGCPIHGFFEQSAANHLMGRGCPSCSTTGFDPTQPAILYYLSINDGQAYKIGITNRTVEERYSIDDQRKISIVSSWYFAVGQKARDAEVQLLDRFSLYSYKGPPLLKNGNSELFKKDVLQMDGGEGRKTLDYWTQEEFRFSSK